MKIYNTGDLVQIKGNKLLCIILNPQFKTSFPYTYGLQVYCVQHKTIYYLTLNDCRFL